MTIEEKRFRNLIAVRKYNASKGNPWLGGTRPKVGKSAAEHTRSWRLRNPEKHRASIIKSNHSLKSKIRQKRFRLRKLAQNPRHFLELHYDWVRRNPKQWNLIMARAKKKRYWNSPRHRLRDLIAGAVLKAVKRNRAIKLKSTMQLLGCTIPELRKWLESQFKNGMTWENMGKFGWHIDHKRPCASFDLTDPKQQSECFHFSNLQPLWWRDNLSKGAKYA